MSKSLRRFLGLGVMLGAALCAGGAPAQPPPGQAASLPVSHAVEFPSGDAAWSVKITRDIGNPHPVPEPKITARERKQIHVVRVGNMRRDTVTWSDGTVTESWWPEGMPMVLFQSRPGLPVRACRLSQMSDARFDEAVFEWVGPATFSGTVSFQGRKCQYYQIIWERQTGQVVCTRAWIDAESHRPVGSSDGVYLAVFAFENQAPQGPLVVPADFQQMMKRCQAYMAARKNPPPQ